MSFAAALGRLDKRYRYGKYFIDDFGVKDCSKIADIVVDQVGIDFDIYALQKSDIVSILEKFKISRLLPEDCRETRNFFSPADIFCNKKVMAG